MRKKNLQELLGENDESQEDLSDIDELKLKVDTDDSLGGIERVESDSEGVDEEEVGRDTYLEETSDFKEHLDNGRRERKPPIWMRDYYC